MVCFPVLSKNEVTIRFIINIDVIVLPPIFFLKMGFEVIHMKEYFGFSAEHLLLFLTAYIQPIDTIGNCALTLFYFSS